MRPYSELQGWLGYDDERRAFDGARLHEDRAIAAGVKQRLQYLEFHEAYDDLQARKDVYAGRPFTWDLERRLHAQGKLPFELIPTHTQDTGDCVAAGLAGTGQKLQVLEIALGGQEEQFRRWDVPWIYAVSRNQIGGGMRGAGSTGAWGARAVNEYGVLFADDPGVPPYSGRSDRWGSQRHAGDIASAVYAEFAPVAKDNPVEITRLTTIEEMVEALEGGMLLTIASYQGFRVTEHAGLHVYYPHGRWMHQMHITDLRRDPELMFYRLNQWGPAHTAPLNNETPGGAWNLASDLDRELSGGGVVVYGYWQFSGHPGEPDHHLI